MRYDGKFKGVAALVLFAATLAVARCGDGGHECRMRLLALEDELHRERVRFAQQRRTELLLAQKTGMLQEVHERLASQPGAESSIDHGRMQRLLADLIETVDRAVSREQRVENILDDEISSVLQGEDKRFHGFVKWVSHLAMIVPLVTIGFMTGRIIHVSPRLLLLLLHANHAVLATLCFVYFLVFRCDPFRSLQMAHPDAAVLLQLLVASEFPLMLGLVWLNAFWSSSFQPRVMYAMQVFPLAFASLDYRWRVWVPAVYGVEAYGQVLYAYLAYALVSCGLFVVSLYAHNPSHRVFVRTRELLAPELPGDTATSEVLTNNPEDLNIGEALPSKGTRKRR